MSVAATAMLVLAAVAQSNAFDLVCTGQTTLSDVVGFSSTPYGLPGKFEHRFRIDLSSRRWCDGDCQATHEINEVSDTMIVFEQSKSDAVGHGAAVSRETGTYIDRTRIFGPKVTEIFLTQASCVRADFSGFPKKLF